MYLKELNLKNFRSFKENKVTFQQNLTILVGENNSGKSNTIDAIRLLTPPLNGRRDMYCQYSDIRSGSGSCFDLSATYADLNPSQQGRLISACSDSELTQATFGVSYDRSSGKDVYGTKPKLWAGVVGRIPEAGSHDVVRHVYLPALRDAKHALASGNPTRIYALLDHFLGEGDRQELAEAFSRSSEHEIINKINESVDEGLKALTGGVRQQVSSLGFSKDEELIEIARDLKFSLSDQGIEPEDLTRSGHGFANLLYMATIAVELQNIKSADLTIFLVEEPEAHLHPQLQAAVLAFLEDQAAKSRQKENSGSDFAGEMQVVVATHSPNLTASVESERLVCLRSVKNASTPQDGISGNSDDRPETRSIALSNLLTTADDKKLRRKVDRYIDVTKASVLFGGRVALVEGIAEAILLPVIAKNIVLKDYPDALRRFRSTIYVPIDGVDFSPYIKLLLSQENEVCISDCLAVITDGDGPKKPDKELSPGEQRKQDFTTLASSLGSGDKFGVFINTYSLENDLILKDAKNEALLKSCFLELHPRSESKWDTAMSGDEEEKSKKISQLFKDVAKGDFAQILSQKIEDGEEFIVPQYLQDAIQYISKEC